MEDTESSDFLSSSDSLWSSASAATPDREDTGYVGFDVFMSEGEVEKEFGIARTLPNSRLTSDSHPVLIHLENEYQTRRSFWQRHMGQYHRRPLEGDERVVCQGKLSGRSSPLAGLKPGKQLKDLVFPDGLNLDAPQGLKRQRVQDAESLASRWKEKNLQVSDGDRIFAQKCRELQGFIRPLTELLNGLKRGRYDRGLSSFQQSVAMDRIQRIVGVLQKPEMGERYLGTLLQVEMMLKIWFPGVNSSSSSSSSSSSADFDMEEPQNKMAKHPDIGSTGHKSCHLRPVFSPSSPTMSKPPDCPSLAQAHTDCACCKEVLSEWPTMNLTWMHTAPICNPPLSQVDLHHLNSRLGQDLFWSNGNNCGIIFLVQNSQTSTSPAVESLDSEDKPLDLRYFKEGTQGQLPRRSQSSLALFPTCDRTDLGQLKTRSHSLPLLPSGAFTSGGENT